MLHSSKTGAFAKPGLQKNPAGFTLIEVIVAMVIIGILSVGAGLGLIQVVESYVFSRQNTEALQEAHDKINRAAIEFSYMVSIDSMSSSSITYTAEDGDGNSDSKTFPPPEWPPSGLSFSYFYYGDPEEDPEEIDDMANVQLVQLIKIEMDVAVGGGGSKTFSTWVAPYRLNDGG